jgi:hypothetical protein
MSCIQLIAGYVRAQKARLFGWFVGHLLHPQTLLRQWREQNNFKAGCQMLFSC